jgi:hypothetical protein
MLASTMDGEHSSEYTATATESGPAAGEIENLSEQASPLPMDVIFGRGQLQHSVPGNIRFHSLIELFLPKYNLATSKKQKSNVVNDIYKAVKETGRFLKTERGSTGYIEADEAAAKEKIGQAIRYKQRKSSKDSNTKSHTTNRRDTVTETTTVGGKQPHLHERHQQRIRMSLAQHAPAPAVAVTTSTTTRTMEQTVGHSKLEQPISVIPIDNSLETANQTLLSILHEQYRQARAQSVGMNTSNDALFTSFAAGTLPQAPAATATSLLSTSSPATGMALPMVAAPSSFAGVPPPTFLTQKPATASLKQEEEEEEIISDYDLMCVLGPPAGDEYEPNAFPSDRHRHHHHHHHHHTHHEHHQNP